MLFSGRLYYRSVRIIILVVNVCACVCRGAIGYEAVIIGSESGVYACVEVCVSVCERVRMCVVATNAQE